MSEVRYMISDAAKLVDVEAHVLRYWEEELELPIGRPPRPTASRPSGYSTARRFISAWAIVSSSTYSSSSPNPMPRAMEVTFTSGYCRSRFSR